MVRRFTSSPVRPSVRFALEELENRLVPADYRWAATGTIAQDWDKPGNWQKHVGENWVAATEVPGAADTATFDDTSTRGVAINGPRTEATIALGKVVIEAAYTGTLFIPAIPVFGAATVTMKQLTMKGGTIEAAVSGSIIELYGADESTITAGTFDVIRLNVEGSPTVTTTLTIDGNISLNNGAKIFLGSGYVDSFTVLNWKSGNIATPPTLANTATDSKVEISQWGTMRISSNGTLGDPGSNFATTRLINSGTLSVSSAPTIAGGFWNQRRFSVGNGANVTIQGDARQSGFSSTELDSGTITTSVYNVILGSLIGNGTIAGNLTLGTSAGESPTLAPGLSGDPTTANHIGTITVTQSLHMISPNVTTLINVGVDGTFDRIVVQGGAAQNGWAVLKGTLNVTFDRHPALEPPFYAPERGTTLTFLSAPTFALPGQAVSDFTTKGINGTNPWLEHGNMNVWKLTKPAVGQYALIATNNHDPIAFGGNGLAVQTAATNFDVLAYATDADGDVLTIVSVTQGQNGTVTINDNGTPTDPTDDYLVYIGDTGYFGTDSFTYTIDDGFGGVFTATISVWVFAPVYAVAGHTLTWDADEHRWIGDGWTLDVMPEAEPVGYQHWWSLTGADAESQYWFSIGWSGAGSGLFYSPIFSDPPTIEVTQGS